MRFNIQSAVDSLSEAEAKHHLTELLPHHPNLLGLLIQQRLHREAAAAAAKRIAPPKDFDYLSKSCWRALNVGHGRKSGWQQYEDAFDIGSTLEQAADEIVPGCMASNRRETRLSAMEALRKISKSLLLCEHGEICNVIMNGTAPSWLVKAMMDVIGEMDGDEELEEFGETDTASGIRWVDDEMRAYGIEAYAEVIQEIDNIGEDDQDAHDDED